MPAPTPPALASAPSVAPTFNVTEAGPSLFDRFKSSIDIEEMLGTDWLNKLGIVLLVLGIAFFLSYELRTMGPRRQGSWWDSWYSAALMLAAGIWFERGDRYRILARAGIGGGWALLFFTTYAMYHVPAAQVLTSQLLDLVLMLAVAPPLMVAHASLSLSGCDGTGVSARIPHRHYQPFECVQSFGGNRTRGGIGRHRWAHAVVRAGSLSEILASYLQITFCGSARSSSPCRESAIPSRNFCLAPEF